MLITRTKLFLLSFCSGSWLRTTKIGSGGALKIAAPGGFRRIRLRNAVKSCISEKVTDSGSQHSFIDDIVHCTVYSIDENDYFIVKVRGRLRIHSWRDLRLLRQCLPPPHPPGPAEESSSGKCYAWSPLAGSAMLRELSGGKCSCLESSSGKCLCFEFSF